MSQAQVLTSLASDSDAVNVLVLGQPVQLVVSIANSEYDRDSPTNLSSLSACPEKRW